MHTTSGLCTRGPLCLEPLPWDAMRSPFTLCSLILFYFFFTW